MGIFEGIVREDRAEAGGLAQEVGAEAGPRSEGVGEVEVAGVAELPALLLAQDLEQQRLGIARAQRISEQRSELALDPRHRGIADGDVQIGSATLEKGFEQVIEGGHQGSPSPPSSFGSWAQAIASSRVIVPATSRLRRESSSRTIP